MYWFFHYTKQKRFCVTEGANHASCKLAERLCVWNKRPTTAHTNWRQRNVTPRFTPRSRPRICDHRLLCRYQLRTRVRHLPTRRWKSCTRTWSGRRRRFLHSTSVVESTRLRNARVRNTRLCNAKLCIAELLLGSSLRSFTKLLCVARLRQRLLPTLLPVVLLRTRWRVVQLWLPARLRRWLRPIYAFPWRQLPRLVL